MASSDKEFTMIKEKRPTEKHNSVKLIIWLPEELDAFALSIRRTELDENIIHRYSVHNIMNY